MFERKNDHTHTWVEERLSDYVDNQLSALDKTKLERHLRECARCQRSLASLRWTISLVKHAPAPALPRSFVLPVPRPSVRPPIISFSVLRLGAAIATLLLISLVGIDLITQLGGAAAPARLTGAREALQPTLSIAQVPIVSPTAPPTEAAKAFSAQDAVAPTAIAPKLAPSTAMPPTLAPPAAGAAATPPPRPTSAPAATGAPTAAPKPAAPPQATSAPTAATMPSPDQRSGTAQAEVRPFLGTQLPTATALPSLGRGAGPGKPTEKSAEPTTAPLQSQPRALTQEAEPTATPTPTATPISPTATRVPTTAPSTATALSKEQARVEPTRPTIAQPPPDTPAPIVTPLRVAELGALFIAVFLGVLALLLRRFS